MHDRTIVVIGLIVKASWFWDWSDILSKFAPVDHWTLVQLIRLVRKPRDFLRRPTGFVFTPLGQWQPTGSEERRSLSVWNFEVCAGAGGGTSQRNAEELQRALQLVLR